MNKMDIQNIDKKNMKSKHNIDIDKTRDCYEMILHYMESSVV